MTEILRNEDKGSSEKEQSNDENLQKFSNEGDIKNPIYFNNDIVMFNDKS